MPTEIRLYLDEHLSPRIAEQLRRKGLTVVTLQDLGALGESDRAHLRRAAEMGCVVCTCDKDFLQMAQQGFEHAGIVFGNDYRHGIGDWVKGLLHLHAEKTAEEMRNQIVFLRRA